MSLTGPLGHEGGGGSGLPGDPTGRAAERVLRAGERVAEAEAWERVFRILDRAYPPDGDHQRIIRLRYWERRQDGRPHQIEDIAEALHYERQTILRKRDEYLTRLAFEAALAGLLTGRQDHGQMDEGISGGI